MATIIPQELFVGDLSFFCQEKHLVELFGNFGPVLEIRIKRSNRGRTLMYGFVQMLHNDHALAAVAKLSGHIFMGRKMR